VRLAIREVHPFLRTGLYSLAHIRQITSWAMFALAVLMTSDEYAPEFAADRDSG
jgi:ABC-type glycerol-3-phosphate transport system permease component